MSHSWLEIRKEALYHNIKSIQSLIGSVQLGIVLKANAYGHGLVPMALLLQNHPDVVILFTAFGYEALELRSAGITKKIVTFVVDEDELAACISNDIEIVCFSIKLLLAAQRVAAQLGKKVKIHIKIDTGMSRLGILLHELDEFFKIMCACENVVVVAAMTHLCDADDQNNDAIGFTQQQIHTFLDAVSMLQRTLAYPLQMIHACASTGLIYFAQQVALHNLQIPSVVRVATNSLGYYKPGAQRQRLNQTGCELELQPILTWKAKIVQVKKIPAGSFVGYGRTHRTSGQTTIAIVPVGYSDGYPRGLSGCGVMLVRGVLVPVIGRVSMNMCMIDVSAVPEVCEGDEVTLLGAYHGITADDIAAKLGTINIVVLSGLKESIKRVVI